MVNNDCRLAAILYTDIVGYSSGMEEDEAGALLMLRFYNTVIAEVAARRRGAVIKSKGGSTLLEFRNTVEALQTALEIQDLFYRYNLEHRDRPLQASIGLHLGDISFFEDDALGAGVEIAARLQSMARPGTVCMSQDVYNQVVGKIDFRARELGRVPWKSITGGILAYEVSGAGVGSEVESGDSTPGPSPGVGAGGPSGVLAKGRTSQGGKNLEYEIGESGNSVDISATVRKAILEDIRSQGRRPTVDEALERYGAYGAEARDTVSRMAEQGLLVRRTPARTCDPGRPDGESLGRDIERAVRGIVALVDDKIGEYEAKRRRDRDGDTDRKAPDSGMEQMEARLERFAERIGRGLGRWNEKAAIRAELLRHASGTETGQWDKELKDSDYFKPGREELASSFGTYREGLADRARKLRGGFLGNLASFLGVNALLWFINLQVYAGPPYFWAAIVTAGWGTGLVSNLAGMLRAKSRLAEADRVPDLEGKALDTYKKLNMVRDSLVRHTASVLTVPGLLFTIHAVATPFLFPWWLIPSGIMAISWVSHIFAFGSARRRLEGRLFKEAGTPGGWRELFRTGKSRRAAAEVPGQYAPLYAEAEAAKDAIAAQVRASGKDSPFDKDLLPSLEEYVGQVRLLTQTVNEIDSILEAVPMKSLARDKSELQVKLGGDAGPSLKAEYQKALKEIEKQETSFRDLTDQREVLRLRLKSSVNALKQMQLDIARLRAHPDSTRTASLDQLRSRTGELSQYLGDLLKGYEEARETEDPWKALERQAAEREAAQKAIPRTEPASERKGQGEPPAGKTETG
ncbi:MAG TPA: adenylate/guanylate cyclase domain-containing protein [Magnetospirillaceae bacterium]|nr:adenylate/guanylate cyclase domain-containing protein [Magnetospirillaceae bacterium]